MHKVAQQLLNANVTLTSAGIRLFHNMLMVKNPEDRLLYLYLMNIRELELDLSSERFDAEDNLLSHLPHMRLHGFRLELFMSIISDARAPKYLLALSLSMESLRHLHYDYEWFPGWSPMIHQCAASLESLTISDMDMHVSKEQMPAFPNLKSLSYNGYGSTPDSLAPMLALIAKAPQLEALEAPFVSSYVMEPLLRKYGFKIRKLTAAGSTIRELLWSDDCPAILLHLTLLKYCELPDEYDPREFLSLHQRYPHLTALEISAIDYDELELLNKALAEPQHLPNLRHLRIQEIFLQDDEKAMLMLGKLWETSLARPINLTTLEVDLYSDWEGCGHMARSFLRSLKSVANRRY